ncbi:MAG: type II toxin-antitoxin system RelE/ParE family toxin [Armatimonadetes bacterium]|nr:type II toxin-antitoxin system RelE/ParE family toxin [Armatimonadota bacterium]
MAQITWTKQALDDLDTICLYIANDSPRFAELFAFKVFQAVERLADFPFSGRVVPEIEQENIREIVMGNYRIIYRASYEEVEVLTVYHSARLLDPLKLLGK